MYFITRTGGRVEYGSGFFGVYSSIRRKGMKILNMLPVAVAPLILMTYGWYLGQLHQSGYDIAGILLFISGAAGLVLASGIRLLTRKYAWHAYWYVNILYGIAGCGVVFALLLALARLHG